MPGGKRLWRTDDGDLVEDGHPDARTLAYGEDDELGKGETVRSDRPAKAAKATPKKAAAPTPKQGE